MKHRLICQTVLTAMVILLSGCGSQNAADRTESYLLETLSPAVADTMPVFDGVLKIRHCRAAAPFDGQYFLYRTSDGRYEQDFYRQFLTQPNEQIAESLRSWIESSNLFGSVMPASSAIEADYMLEPQLLAIYTDFSDAAQPKTVVKIHTVLLRVDRDDHSTEVVFEKTYLRSETFQDKTGKSIITGYNAGLESIFTQLVQDIREKQK